MQPKKKKKKRKINLYICSGPSSLQKGKLIHRKVLSEPPQVMHDTPWWRSSDLASPSSSPRRAETVSRPASLGTACIIQGSLPDELNQVGLSRSSVCVCVCVCVCAEPSRALPDELKEQDLAEALCVCVFACVKSLPDELKEQDLAGALCVCV